MSTDLVPLLVEEQTDHDLVAAHRAGGLEAFEVLCRRYRTRLVGLLARRTKDRDLAEDLAQEALLRAYQSLDGFDTSKPMWPWLKAIGLNLATDYSRSPLYRQVPTDDETLDTASEATPLQDPSETIAERNVLVMALAALNPRQRAAVGLRYLDGWSISEVGQVMGMEANAVAQLLMRSRRRLCSEYKDLTREKLHGWALPLLWPYYALRDRLDRARDAIAAAAPGPALAAAEAFAAAAAVGALTAAFAVGSLIAPSASLAGASTRAPDRVTPVVTDSSTVAPAPASVTGSATPASTAVSTPTMARPSHEVAPVVVAPTTTTSSGPGTSVRVTPTIDKNDERVLVRVETDQYHPVFNRETQSETMVQSSCDGPVGSSACDAAEALPED